MKHLTLLGMLVLALALAPTATAQSSSDSEWAYVFAGETQLMTVEVGPNAILFTLHDITVDGELAADARTAIDNLQSVGDGNGELSESEVVAFEALATATINANLPSEFDIDMVTLDGKKPYSNNGDALIQLSGLRVEDAEGPADSTAPIRTTIGAKLFFDSVSQSLSKHQVRFENVYGDFTSFDASQAPPAELRISGYKSWDLIGDTVSPTELQGNLDGGDLVLTKDDISFFSEKGQGLAFTVEGDPADFVGSERESPGAGLMVSVVLLGAVLFAARRRF